MAAAAALKAACTAAVLALLLGAGCAWTIAFTAFDQAVRRAAAAPPPADAIVVLTGGADRIEKALELLVDGAAPELLISGVGRGGDLDELARRAQIDVSAVRGRITIGRAATSTTGNAAETASWAQSRPIQRLIVVTAGYHMPRALRELHARLPSVALYPVAVQPQAMRGLGALATLHLLSGEFDKLLAVWLGLPRLTGRDVG